MPPAVIEELKQVERMRLLRTALPLTAAGLGISGLYAGIAATSGLMQFWFGPGLAGAGFTMLVWGYSCRLREIRGPLEPTSRHYA